MKPCSPLCDRCTGVYIKESFWGSTQKRRNLSFYVSMQHLDEATLQSKGEGWRFSAYKTRLCWKHKKEGKRAQKTRDVFSWFFLAKNVISSWCLPFFSVSQAKLLRKSLLQMIWNDSISYARYVNNAHSHASFCCPSWWYELIRELNEKVPHVSYHTKGLIFL